MPSDSGFYNEFMASFIEERLLAGDVLTPKSAWRFIYRAMLWMEQLPTGPLPHIVEANDLRRSWASRGLAARQYLLQNLDSRRPLLEEELLAALGQIYERRGGGGRLQPNNIVGRAFEEGITQLIARLCPGVIPMLKPRLSGLQGFEMAPPGYHSQPDLALFSPTDFRVIVSTKWTLRKDRVGGFLHEAYFYRQRRPDINIAFVVNEFKVNILWYLVTSPLVDQVYHVHVPLFEAAHQDGSEDQHFLEVKARLHDLSELFPILTKIREHRPTGITDQPEIEE